MAALMAATTTEPTAPVKQAASEVAQNTNSITQQVAHAIPYALIAIVMVAVGFAVVRVGRRYVEKMLAQKYSPDFSHVTAKIIGWLVMLFVVLVAVAAAFPSVNMASVLSSMGFVSIAVGFAAKEIIENSFAGWLLMYRETFKVGDQIEVTEIFGDVQAVNMRETVIRQRDGQKVIIPNRDVYRSNIRIQTAHPHRRFDFYLLFDYDVDHHHVIEVLVDAIGEVDGVLSDPPPKGRIDDTGAENVHVKLMGWTQSDQSTFNDCRNRVIQHVIDTMITNNIPLPDAVVDIDVDSLPPAPKTPTRGTGAASDAPAPAAKARAKKAPSQRTATSNKPAKADQKHPPGGSDDGSKSGPTSHG